MSDDSVPYTRVLLKLSGEILGGGSFGIDVETTNRIAQEVKEAHELGVEIALVIGGGNFFRGVAGAARGMDRTQADNIGMMATVINALALQDALERIGCYTRVMSAIAMDKVAEPYIRRRAVRHLEKGRVVIFAAGTGNPYFSTDMAASLRAAEVNADVILKGTKVDGVYDRDPMADNTAKRYSEITHLEAVQRGLKAMDVTAISLCMENNLPIIVFDLTRPGNIRRVLVGEDIGTHVRTLA